MLTFSTAIVLGAAILIADFAVWRALGPGRSKARRAWRCAVFIALTYLLFASGVNPLMVPAVPDRLLRVALQVLGVAWWFECSLFINLVLRVLVLPRSWHTQRLFHDIASAVVFIAAAVAAFGYVLGLPVSGLVATSGAMAVIFGLAIQNTLNDLFSGLVLNTAQPFRLGDVVRIGDVEGKVVENNWRATTLLNGHGNFVVVPNSVAAKTTIVNLSEPPNTHGVTLTLNVDPEVRPAVVLEALERAAVSSREVLASPAPVAAVKTFRTNSIEYELACYVASLDRKTSVRNELYDLAHRHLSSADVDLRPLSVPARAQPRISRRQRLLRAVEMFKYVEEEDLLILEAALTPRQFDKGEVIYASDSDSRMLTIVDSGVVSVTVPNGKGDVEVRRMVPGDAIGQSAVLAAVKLHATARAVTPVTAYQLRSEDLSPLIGKNPEIGRQMCRVLSESRAVEERIMVPADETRDPSFSILTWLEKGMRRLHQALA
jgi:small-conductance mechanosensitive channel